MVCIECTKIIKIFKFEEKLNKQTRNSMHPISPHYNHTAFIFFIEFCVELKVTISYYILYMYCSEYE